MREAQLNENLEEGFAFKDEDGNEFVLCYKASSKGREYTVFGKGEKKPIVKRGFL